MTITFSFDNKRNLWGDSYHFHSKKSSNKTFLVIADKCTNKYGSYYSLDFCTHNNFNDANELLYYLSFPYNSNMKRFKFLLENSGGGKEDAYFFFTNVISFYTKLCDQENLQSSCVNIFIANTNGMKRIADFCLKNGFIRLGNCLSYRASNFIPINERKRLIS